MRIVNHLNERWREYMEPEKPEKPENMDLSKCNSATCTIWPRYRFSVETPTKCSESFDLICILQFITPDHKHEPRLVLPKAKTYFSTKF